MSRHTVTLTIDLDDSNESNTQAALEELATGLVSHAIDTLWAGSSQQPRPDGYSGPFLDAVIAAVDGVELNV